MKNQKIIIDSDSNTIFSLKELVSYKSLLNNLAKRDFLIRYKQAFAGIMWALVKPLINIIVFGFFAGKINPGESAATNYIYVASAMVLWQLFSSIFNDVSNSIISNSALFSKVYFPKIIIPLSSLLVCLIDFAISLIILIALFIFTGTGIHWQIILAPLFIILTVINGFGIGLYFATINVKFRDVKFIVPVMIQVGMFVSPVIVSAQTYLNEIPYTFLKWLYCLNPMVGAIEGFKYSLFGGTMLETPYFIGSLFISFLFLVIGIKYFYKFERSFVDYI